MPKGYKNKNIEDSVYDELLRYMRPDESFSKALLRILEYARKGGMIEEYRGPLNQIGITEETELETGDEKEGE